MHIMKCLNESLLVDGTISTDQGEISEYIGQFYNNMFF
jgi:hypothetical protein